MASSGRTVLERAVAGLILGSAFALRVLAHPGNGIVALGFGRVLTGDAVGNGVWLFELGKPPKRQTDHFHCHWLTRGLDGKLYAENQAESNGRWTASHFRLDGLGTKPARLGTAPLAHSIFTVDRQGRVVSVDAGRVKVRSRSGELTPFRGNGKVAGGDPPLESVTALVWGPREVLYLADGPHIRKIGADGTVRLVTTFSGPATVPMYGGRGGAARIWGLAVDESGKIYAALASHGLVVSIDASGKRNVVSSGQSTGWLATGVAIGDGSLYLLETKLEGNRNLGPRVRLRDPSGKWFVMGTVGTR